tara:strand:+ start:112 stop:297 length:186 start_codon:yes stop_codon:yes gene_type:complete
MGIYNKRIKMIHYFFLFWGIVMIFISGILWKDWASGIAGFIYVGFFISAIKLIQILISLIK